MDTEQNNGIVVFDHERVRGNRLRAAAQFAEHDFLFREVADRLADRLLDVTRGFDAVAELGARGDALLSHLKENSRIGEIVRVTDMNRSTWNTGDTAVTADIETLPFADDSLDLIISNLALHWVNDLPGLLLQIRKALKPDGLFLATMFGGETLTELRQALMQAELNIRGGASPRVSPFVDLRDAAGLLQRAGFALPVADSDRITVSYDNIFKLMRDLRGMGETNAVTQRDRRPVTRRMMMEAARIYAENFADADGRIRATFDVITLTGWSPSAAQQKPLRPGSAEASLAEALGATEQETDDPAKP